MRKSSQPNAIHTHYGQEDWSRSSTVTAPAQIVSSLVFDHELQEAVSAPIGFDVKSEQVFDFGDQYNLPA